MKKITLAATFAAMFALAGSANANFLVRDYTGANSLAAVQAKVASNTTPSFIGTSNVVDFYANGGGDGAFTNDFAFPGGLLVNFGADFKTNLNLLTGGTFSFRTNADDGVQLLIDGVSVISDSTLHPPQDFFSSNLTLSAGLHSIELLFFQNQGGASVELSAASVNGESTGKYFLVGSADGLKTTNVPEPTTLALLGLGLFGFAASRRKSAK